MPKLLHLGAGTNGRAETPKEFHAEEWIHTTVDLDVGAKPDIVDDISTLVRLSGEYDAIYCCHALEHLNFHRAIEALKRWRELLVMGGDLVVVVPNLRNALRAALDTGLVEVPLYESPAGPIYPMDVIYGHTGMSIEHPLMQHHCGFTPSLLVDCLEKLAGGYDVAQTISEPHNLTVVARKVELP